MFAGAQFDGEGTFNAGSRDENGVFYKMCKTKFFVHGLWLKKGSEERSERGRRGERGDKDGF